MIASGLEAKLLAAQAESGAANLRRAIAFAAVGGPLELQALGVRDRPGSQYDATKAAHALTTHDGVRLAAEAEKWSAQGVYILPATLRTGVETRHSAPGSWYTIPKRGGTADSDIAARQVLAIDLDVDRPTNTSATDAEMALSVAVACRALEYLAPVVGADSLAYVHSGNGRQVWLALDSLPVSSEVKALLAAVLAGLASLLDTPSVHVDLTLVDAKRILPACGTTKKKGAPGIPDRPHRRTAIVTPEHVNRLSEVSLRRLLERLRQDCGADGGADGCAAIDKALGVRPEKPRPATTAGTATGARPFEAANKLDPTQVAQWLGLLDGDHPRCPGCGEADSGVAILDHGFKCSHNRCQHLGRQGFRTAVDLTMEVRGLNKFEAVNALAERFGFDPLPAWDPSRSKANGANGHGSNGAAQGPRERPWPEFEPFDSVTLPPFPVEALSPWLRDWAVAEAEFTQTPVDMAAMLALATAALVVSRGVDVMVKPGWVEPANVWVVVGAAPGTRKSPVFEAATRPVFEYQRLAAKQLEVPLANYLSDKKIIEGKVEAAERAAMKNKSFEGEDARDAAARLRSDLRDLKVVAAPNLLAADTTPEALTLLLSENGERVGIFSPEGGPIEAMAGRYSELPNLDIWLQGHDGGAYTVARVKRAAIFLARPLITIAIATQPAVIEGMGAEKLGRNKGLLARFLFCLPTSTVGNRKTDPDPVSELVSRAYSHAMSSMLVHVPERPRRLALSSSANDARATFQRGIERRIGPDGDLAHIADWAGKLVGLVARLACVLHCADNADRLHLPPTETEEDGYGMPTTIPLTTWLRAQQIGEFALEHAVHAFSCMEATEAETSARRLLKWIARRSLSTFAATDARRDLHLSAEVCDAALALLTTRGYVRRGPPAPPTGGRPASARFDVRQL